jgi:hypothetical protein
MADKPNFHPIGSGRTTWEIPLPPPPQPQESHRQPFKIPPMFPSPLWIAHTPLPINSTSDEFIPWQFLSSVTSCGIFLGLSSTQPPTTISVTHHLCRRRCMQSQWCDIQPQLPSTEGIFVQWWCRVTTSTYCFIFPHTHKQFVLPLNGMKTMTKHLCLSISPLRIYGRMIADGSRFEEGS